MGMKNLIFDDSVPGVIRIGSDLANNLGFTKDKFDGYLWNESDGSVVISMIISLDPGKGNVKKLIDTLKSRYKKIYVPVPSPRMKIICEKSGFKEGVITDEMGSCEAMIYEEG